MKLKRDTLNANLATIVNSAENDFVYNIITTNGETSAWIGYYSLGSTPNFGWFDNNSSTFQNWSGSEPDLNSGSDAVGAILGFLNTAVWIDGLQIQTGNGIYKD